ncbi:hypothetical protein HY641_00915 [Candidatus Woesearchaeota archaeon]|nr:hypothetical protein [Candidatus Woesearchaeota archaeon]
MRYTLCAIAVLLIIASCTKAPSCPAPNVTLSGECCLDANADGFCDKYQEPARDDTSGITPVTVSPMPTPASPTIEKPVPQVSDAHKKWAERLGQKVKSYQFVTRIADQYHGTVYVLGPRVRVDLDNAITVNTEEGTENKINRIYANTDEGTALGVCGAGFILCKSRKGEAYTIPYKRYAPQLPTDIFDKVKNLPLELEQPNAEIIQDRQTTLLRYVDNNVKHNVFVDQHYGMPLVYRKESAEGGPATLTEWKSMAFNTVVEKDFDMPILA